MQVRFGRAARLRPLIKWVTKRVTKRVTAPLTATPTKAAAGFTLLELIVVLVIVGILAGIAAPGWMAFLSERHLSAAQDRVHQAMREAQSRAKTGQVSWQASFREADEKVQWAIHPITTLPADALWNSLDSSVRLDDETTLSATGGVRRVQFNRRGVLTGNGGLGRITLASKSGGKAKRCVIVSTLLGVTRKGQNQPTQKDGKYCR